MTVLYIYPMDDGYTYVSHFLFSLHKYVVTALSNLLSQLKWPIGHVTKPLYNYKVLASVLKKIPCCRYVAISLLL